MAFRRQVRGWSLGGLLLVACSGSPQPVAPEGTFGEDGSLGSFQAERAWADLNALAGVGPRPPGSKGARAGRRYIREALEGVDLEVEERVTPVELPGLEPFELTHLRVVVPGASPDRFILLSAYDSDHYEDVENAGVNYGASGAALLVEVARVLSESRPAYTVELLFVEGEGRLGIGEGETLERRGLGSELLAAQMAESGELEGVRLLIAFRGVCDADLQVARDLLSNRHHREEIWRVARDLGYGDVFPRDAHFQTVEAGHRPFRDQGLRVVVAVSDTAYGGTEPPGVYADGADDVIDHCAAASLATVGTVALHSVRRIGERLDRIERFTRRPLAEPIADAPVAAEVPGPEERVAAGEEEDE